MQEVEVEAATAASPPPPPRRVLLISAGASHSVALLCKLYFFFNIRLRICPFDLFVLILKFCHFEWNGLILLVFELCGYGLILILFTAGNVVCSWGRGEDGQLGHGDTVDRLLPTQLSALDAQQIVSVVCGADHTIAYSDSRVEVYSWGWYAYSISSIVFL